MSLILKILVGVVVGLGYGVLVGGVLLLVSFVANDPPVDLMLDPSKIIRFLILLATIISGSAGALVGLTVTVLRANKIKGGMIGFGFGLIVLAGVLFKISPQLKNELSAIDSWFQVSFLFLIFLVLFIMFPVGLAATGATAVVMSDKFASRQAQPNEEG